MEEEDSMVDQLMRDVNKPSSPSANATTTTTHTPLLDLDLDESVLDFACSPLLPVRSSKPSSHRHQNPHPEVIKGKGEMQNPCFSSPNKNKGNKENANENQVGGGSPSSAVGSQSTKKRKKRGGFNLRKSLAWNNAFFTEEGVLDPVELSRLSHSFSKPGLEFLSSVAEEGSGSLVKGSKASHGSNLLQSIEEDLFSELPQKSLSEDQRGVRDIVPITVASVRENSASSPSIARKVHPSKSPYKNVSQAGGCPQVHPSKSPNRNVSQAGVCPQVHPTKSPYRSVSQAGGCPRPNGPSSQKRLPIASAISGTMKDSKIPKRAVSKSESSSVSSTFRATAAAPKTSKCNQKIPAATIEKNVGKKVTLNKTKTTPSMTSSSSKPSALHSLKNMAATRGSMKGLKVDANPLACADSKIQTGKVDRKLAASNPQDAQPSSGNIPYRQSIPAKPSGLRMPSPSMGYFGQPTTSGSNNIQSLRYAQPSNNRESCIPNPTKFGPSKQIVETLGGNVRDTKRSTGTTTIGAKALSSVSKCMIRSSATSITFPTLQSERVVKNQQMEAKTSDCQSVSSQINSQKQLHKVHAFVEGGNHQHGRNGADNEGERATSEKHKLGDNAKAVCADAGSPETIQEEKLPEDIKDDSLKTGKLKEIVGGSQVSLDSTMDMISFVEENIIRHNHVEIVETEFSATNMLTKDHDDGISHVKFDNDSENCGIDTPVVLAESSSDALVNFKQIFGQEIEPTLHSANEAEQIQHKETESIPVFDCVLVENCGPAEESQKNYGNCAMGTKMVHVESTRFALHGNGNTGEIAAVMKPDPDEGERIQYKQSERVQVPDNIHVEQTSVVHVESPIDAHHTDDIYGELVEPLRSGSDEAQQVLHKENKNLQLSDVQEQRASFEDSEKGNENSDVGSSMVHLESSSFAHQSNGIHHKENRALHMPENILVEPCEFSEEFQNGKSFGSTAVSSTSGCEMGNIDLQCLVGPAMQLYEGVTEEQNMEFNHHAEGYHFEPLHNNASKNDNLLDTESAHLVAVVNMNGCASIVDGVDEHTEEELNFIEPGSVAVEELPHKVDCSLEMNGDTLPLRESVEELQRDKHRSLVLEGRSSEQLDDKDNSCLETTNGCGTECRISNIHSQELLIQVEKGGAGDNTINRLPTDEALLEYVEMNAVTCHESNTLHEYPIDDSTEDILGSKSSPALSKEPSTDSTTCNIQLVSSSTKTVLSLGLENSGNTPVAIGVNGSQSCISLERSEIVQYKSCVIPGDIPDCEMEDAMSLTDETTLNLELVSSSTEKVASITASSGNAPDHLGNNGSENCISSEITEANEIPDGELKRDLENRISLTKSTDAAGSGKKISLVHPNHDALTLKYQQNATPFSDERLAALEAAGEDNLTMKTGAVQISPVKKNNQEMGPSDCTKATSRIYYMSRAKRCKAEYKQRIKMEKKLKAMQSISSSLPSVDPLDCSNKGEGVKTLHENEEECGTEKMEINHHAEGSHFEPLQNDASENQNLSDKESTDRIGAPDILESESSLGLSKERGTDATTCDIEPSTEEVLSLVLATSGNTPDAIGVNGSQSCISHERSETVRYQSSVIPDILDCEMEDAMSPTGETTHNIELVSSSTEEVVSITASSGNAPDYLGDNGSENSISVEKTGANPSQSDEIPDGELKCELENGVSPAKPTDATGSAKKTSLVHPNLNALTLKYQLKATPFSDEWLAALEAAGEDILTMKTGAVQNSPPEKSLPEPSPWSPVKKKKNQEIGPFDCTKCTNLTPPNIQ